MIKRTLGMLLALCLFLGSSVAAASPAALAPDEAWLAQMGAVKVPETRRWVLTCPETQAVIDRITSGELRVPSRTQVYFFLQLEVDAATSRMQPVLVFYLFGARPTGTRAVSIGVDHVRYDFPATVESLVLGGLKGEALRIALNAEGLEMLAQLAKADDVVLRFYGQSVVDVAIDPEDEVKRTGSGQPDWASVLHASLDGIPPMLALLQEAGMGAYALGAQSDVAWKLASGHLPQMDTYTATSPKEAMRMWQPGDRNSDIEQLQELLAQQNLYYGPVSGLYNALTQKAVLRVQEQAGHVLTGCADEQVWRYLRNPMTEHVAVTQDTEVFTAQEGKADFGQTYAMGKVLSLSLDRYWYARAVLPSQVGDPMLGVIAQNSDHILLALDGRMQNLGTLALDLYWQLPAMLIYDGEYSFPCTIQRERDLGTRFDTQLLPLDTARVVFCAELPRAVVESEASLRLEITLETEKLVYTLR